MLLCDDKMAELKLKIPDKLEREIKDLGIDVPILLKRLIKHLEEEKEMTDWSVKLQHASRKGRFDELKRKGLV